VWVQRPLLPDEAVQISGKEFKAHLSDYSDLVATRVRPKDRLALLAVGHAGQPAIALQQPSVTLEERMARPWLAGRIQMHSWKKWVTGHWKEWL
jgi:hypothetical protein